MDLVPIKVKIGLRANGHADHPDWHKLPLAETQDPANQMFFGWKYDKTSGHQEESTDSPYGMQWGMVFVTPLFARQALVTFPELVTVLTEEQAQAFWDDKAHAHLSDEKRDVNVLVALKAELDLRTAIGGDTRTLEAKIAKALDPDNIEPGVKRNVERRFDTAKATHSLKVVTL